MAKVTGQLSDFGYHTIPATLSPELVFIPSGAGVDGVTILTRKPVHVTPAANGYFEVDLEPTVKVFPARHYDIVIQYLTLPTRKVERDVLPWTLEVPTAGGILGDLLKVPSNPALTWSGEEPPGNPSPGTWWMKPSTGYLYEYGAKDWVEKAQLRGPAGYNATTAAQDDAAIAAFMRAGSGPTATGTALADLVTKPLKKELDILGIRITGLTGAGDESATIQAAIDAAPAGARLAMPAGFYLAQGLLLKPGQEFIGQGRGATTLRAAGVGPGYLIRTQGGCRVAHIKLQTGEFDTTLVDIYATARATFDNLYLEGNANLKVGTGLRYNGTGSSTSSHGNQVSSIIAMNLGVGIWGQSWCYDNEFSQVWIGPCGIGMQMSSGSHMIDGLHIWGCTGNGLSLYTLDGGYSRVSNAYLETNGGYGLYVQNNEGNSFLGVRMWKNGAGGGLVRNGRNSRFVGCWADDNTGAGLTFQDHLSPIVTNFHAYDIQAVKTQTYGIRTTGTSDYLNLSASICAREDHKTGSYSLVGSHNKIAGNTFDRSTSAFEIGHTEQAAINGVTVRGAAGFAKTFTLIAGTAARWFFGSDGTAETGANAGADFVFQARNDTGGAINTPLHIERATGKVSLAAPLRLARITTPARPTPAAAGAGAVLYDSTLSKIIYSDGGAWRALDGTVA